MPEAYSNDLRRKLLEAYEEGQGTLEELAERFSVSEGWAKKISAVYNRTQKMERPAGAKRGRESRVTAEVEEYLRKAVTSKPDSTLEELRTRLNQDKQVQISIGWLWLVLRRLGLSFKKNSARQRARQRTSARDAREIPSRD
jgi:transposase